MSALRVADVTVRVDDKTLVDAATGIAIAAPVYWMFTKVLNINLPGLTGTGWLACQADIPLASVMP